MEVGGGSSNSTEVNLIGLISVILEYAPDSNWEKTHPPLSLIIRGRTVESGGVGLHACHRKLPLRNATIDFDRCRQIIGRRADYNRSAAVSKSSLLSLRSSP